MKRFSARVVLAVLFVVVAPAAIAGCAKKEDPTAGKGGPAGGGKGKAGGRGARGGGNLSFPVDTLKVEVKKNEYLIKAPGTLEAFERVQVTARVSGVVDKVSFREGQEVKKGAVLVTIDSERYRVTVNTAKAMLEKSKASQLDVEGQVTRREGAMAWITVGRKIPRQRRFGLRDMRWFLFQEQGSRSYRWRQCGG